MYRVSDSIYKLHAFLDTPQQQMCSMKLTIDCGCGIHTLDHAIYDCFSTTIQHYYSEQEGDSTQPNVDPILHELK